jgi:hypothetical protein
MATILLSIHHTQGCENTSETNQKEHGKVETPMMDTLVLDPHLRRRGTKSKKGLVIDIINSHGLA